MYFVFGILCAPQTQTAQSVIPPDSSVCSVFTVNALLGQCRILCSWSMPQTAQSVLCSRSMPYSVLCPRQPSLICVHGQCPSGSMPYSVLCPRQPSLFCVHGQCPIGSMPYSVFTVNAPGSPICSVFTVNALLLYSVFTVNVSDRPVYSWVNAVYCVHDQCPRPYGTLKVA